jgi:preprotein translocase subunit SecD
MARRNTVVFLIILALFAFAICSIIYPLFGRDAMRLGLDLKGGIHLVYQADFSGLEPGTEAEAMDGAIAVIEKRINVLGVTEPLIQKQGSDRIVVELPGVSEVEKATSLIGETALLEFREQQVDANGNVTWVPATATINGEEKELTSAYFLENTYVGQDNMGRVLLYFEWNDEGSQISAQVTGRLIGQPLAIFLSGQPLLGDNGQPIAPIVQSQITDRGQIEGLSLNEATELSKLLNAGRIPVPLSLIYQQTVSPILGADFVDMSIKAGLIGIILVILFMIVYYRLPGALASLALIFYGAAVLAIFKLWPITLTLAGIGGFVLSIGMAVDANVLIFERMKEEFAAGKTLGAAIEAGFNRAWTAIRDGNVTTIIVCVILIWLGSSVVESAPITGFAVTLLIGVLVSMFSAIIVTRTLLRLFVGTKLGRKTSLFSIHQEKK